MQQAEALGLEGFLLKPVSPSMLFDSIMQAFGKAVPEISRITQKKEQEAEAFKQIQGARLLLVEDNEINQQVAKEILEGADLHVTLATNGQEAVNAVKENYYDAVLMDVQMPVMDGYTATKTIRKWEGGMRNKIGKDSDLKSKIRDPKSKIRDPKSKITGVPIIAMTAHAMAGDEDKSLQAGMNGHVTKPIDPDQLFAALQKWIKPIEERMTAPQPVVSAEAPAEVKVAPAKDELPESLPGFDLSDGLKRLQGNKTLYRKLLLNFGSDYCDTASDIRTALDAEDFENAHSLIHNLKGLAGNLAATGLQAAAVEMEKLVKGQTAETADNKELNRKFKDLESALEQALDAVQTLSPMAEKERVEGFGDDISSLPSELTQEVIDRIKAAAEMGDVMQIKSMAAELKSKSDAAAPFCDKIIQLAEDFDFDGITKFMLDLKR
jgi:CheY-like chemotaxis protein